MQCPKCQAAMEVIHFNKIEIDRCTGCHGLWFDHLEKEDLKQLAGAEAIDVGDEFMGAKFDRIEHVDCPRCKQATETITANEPYPIRFELCSHCGGSFYDAGEFRDYLEEEMLEQFMDLLP